MAPSKANETFDFEGLRKRLGLTQPEMAQAMNMSARTYFSLENDPAAIGARHIMLAQMISLKLAVERNDKTLADPVAAELAETFCAIGRPPKRRWV